MITKETIIEAYLFLRKNNMSVPDETLDFMKHAALEKLQESKVKNSDLFSIPVVNDNYYWVKCFKDSEYEPAKAKDRYGNGEMYFCFTDGSVKECKHVVDYKELQTV
jgi:hypothetical protein